ncbi:MAG: uroporphyrinogen-III synthase [Saccharospirillaceae bacterium]|nr:uroporphyrinogen-III synthase [Pseudomonadales bacterium]NRB77075.1 uroporphyrinogen-III synthase [Saccharospirillaceae bacterium]
MTRFFITRPENQAFELMQKLEVFRQKYAFEHWPIFKIEDIELSDHASSWLYNFDEYDYVFVASKYAAQLLLDYLDERWPMLPLGPEYVCPGSGTASVLMHIDRVISYPNKKMDSDGVLNMSMFSSERLTEPKKWLITSGEGGRRKIQSYLNEHKQQVDELDLYQRIKLNQPPVNLPQKGDVVVVTSSETLEQVELLLKHKTQDLVLWVSSERIKQKAKNWQSIAIIQNALDQTILQAVEDYE